MKDQTFDDTLIKKHWGIVYGPEAKYDDKDLEILGILTRNARTSLIKIAKQVGLSHDAVRYRIKKMIDSDIIMGFVPILNPPMMGFNSINWVLIAFGNYTPELEKEFLNHCLGTPEITYVTSIMGKWDYHLTIFARNPGHFNEVMKKLREKFSDIIKDYDTFTTIEELKWTHFPFKDTGWKKTKEKQTKEKPKG